ncbi:hypothetical protein O9H85_00590 [Paenibacillus filicis]|uniref:ABC transporter substrate-binding protein n=1 Tax=Paenibacillus gyeongsangnamensis TaxID=3388067 RepID=A0ABT4Q259_9BACL|nr:hypothetical protein [Paenibacillus filicis]MCZ8510956.1 hypothetical protein [Paenibacillus filicis]
MKKKLSSFIALSMLASVTMTGCSSDKDASKGADSSKQQSANVQSVEFPLKEKTKYSIVQSRSDGFKPYQSLTAWNEQFEKKSNVHIDWQDWGTGDAYKQRSKLAFASSDLPDAFYGGFAIDGNEYTNYSSQGLLIPIEKMINKDIMPNFTKLVEKNPDLLKQMTAPDGHIYGLPSYQESTTNTNDTLLYNKLWLDKLGMTIPTTTDEFYNYLKAIKAAKDLNGNGKDDEIPLTFRFGTNGSVDKINGISSLIGFTGLIMPQNMVDIKDGKVIFVPGQPEYKEAMKFLGKLGAEGLIDKEAFTMDSNAYNAKVTSKVPSVGAAMYWSTANANTPIGSDVFVYGPPLKGPDGKQRWAKRVTPVNFDIAFAITNKAKNPEILLKWADMHYDTDTSIQNLNGPYDKYIKKLGNGQFEEILKPDGKQYSSVEKSADTPVNFSLYVQLAEDYKLNKKTAATLSKEEAEKIYSPYFPKEVFMSPFMDQKDSERVTIITTDIGQYVTKMTAKWIYSGGVEADWNEYLNQLKKLGIDELVNIQQKYYDKSK